MCESGEADFGSGCEAATATADACASGTCISAFDSTFHSDGTCVTSCPAATYTEGDECVGICSEGYFTDTVNGNACVTTCPSDLVTNYADDTCVASCPEDTFIQAGNTCVTTCALGNPDSGNICPCSYDYTACTAGAVCPGGTVVSTACEDRSAFGENPCACTALQELAALSDNNLQTEVPWSNLASNAYCASDDDSEEYSDSDYESDLLNVACTTTGNGVSLPLEIECDACMDSSNQVGVPTSIGDLGTSLTKIELHNNDFTGAIPTEIALLTSLTWIKLEDNALTSLPTEIGLLTNLKYLYLTGNDIVGAIPTEIGALTELVDLAANDNQLSSVPSQLGSLRTTLRVLRLNNNAIAALPGQLASLTTLRTLQVEDNLLTGLPAAFQSWGPITRCELSGNPSDSGFSSDFCANVGATTSCCTVDNCGDTAYCYAG